MPEVANQEQVHVPAVEDDMIDYGMRVICFILSHLVDVLIIFVGLNISFHFQYGHDASNAILTNLDECDTLIRS